MLCTFNVTHLVPKTYGPWTFGPPQLAPNWLVPLDKQSPTNSVYMDKWSAKIWSSWTNVPQSIWSLGQMVPRIFCLSRVTGSGDPQILGPNWLWTFCPGGPNFGGPFVHGDRIWWGPFVLGHQFLASFVQGKGSGGLKVRESNGFGTECVFLDH